MVSAPVPPHMNRSVEHFETRNYNQPPQMEPQPVPVQTGVTETRFERQEVHGIQHAPQVKGLDWELVHLKIEKLISDTNNFHP